MGFVHMFFFLYMGLGMEAYRKLYIYIYVYIYAYIGGAALQDVTRYTFQNGTRKGISIEGIFILNVSWIVWVRSKAHFGILWATLGRAWLNAS